MRRTAFLFLLALPLASCGGDFVDFLGNTHTIGTSPNSPAGNSETMRRARGLDTPFAPLQPEPGNVWPGEVQLGTPPTLQDLQKNPAAGLGTGGAPDSQSIVVPPSGDAPLSPALPDHRQPRPARPPGSSTPPGSVQPNLAPAPSLSVPNLSAPPPPPPGTGVVVPQSNIGQAPGVTTGSNGNFRTFNTPGGAGGIMVPNGNGTSTLIKPDGTISTVPTPR